MSTTDSNTLVHELRRLWRERGLGVVPALAGAVYGFAIDLVGGRQPAIAETSAVPYAEVRGTTVTVELEDEEQVIQLICRDGLTQWFAPGAPQLGAGPVGPGPLEVRSSSFREQPPEPPGDEPPPEPTLVRGIGGVFRLILPPGFRAVFQPKPGALVAYVPQGASLALVSIVHFEDA